MNTIYVTNIVSVNHVLRSKPLKRSSPPRKQCALAYKLYGRSVYTLDGVTYPSDPHHVTLLCKDKPYTFECIEPGLTIMIEFDCATQIDGFSSVEISEPKEVEKLFHSMAKSWAKQPCPDLHELLSTLYLVFSKYFFQTVSRDTMPFMQGVLDYIENNLDDKHLSNDILARIAKVSTVYFRKLFTRYYGVSPMRYVQNVRIERAKALLVGDYVTIADVAEVVGFADIYTFSRAFTKAVGCSPTAYAKRYR